MIPTHRSVLAALAGALAWSATLSAAPVEPAPTANKQPVVDEYQGVKVTDDYRWLEKPDDPNVKSWVVAQNKRTRGYFDALGDHDALAGQLKDIIVKITTYYRGLESRPGRLFALKFAPPKQQPLLVALKSADDTASEKIVLDPNELEPKGQTTVDWFVPSPDGRTLAVSLSQGGSEDGTLYFYNAETGERLPDYIPRVQYPTGGGSAAWRADGKGIYYTRYPSPGERPEDDLHFYQQVYFHALGAPEKDDAYVIGKDFPRIAEIALQAAPEGPGILAAVNNGDGGETGYFLLATLDGAWQPVAGYKDGIKQAAFALGEPALYLRSIHDAPRGKILRLPFSATHPTDAKDAAVIVPASADSIIESFAVGRSHLYVSDLIGGPSRLRGMGLDGKDSQDIPMPPVSGVAAVLTLDDNHGAIGDRLLFRQSSYVAPSAWYLFASPTDGQPGKAVKTALVGTAPVDFSDIEVVREFAVSKDGTKVPMNILRRKGTKLDGSNPVLLTGYGGYGVNMTPGFDPTGRLWFDRGGVFVEANLRGGGEYGEEWHIGGNLLRKQNVFDDFAACAQALVKLGYTTPGRLAVEGGSNGGLLMGAFLTQHPELARAVVSHVGIYDMLRVEHDPNGSFNVTEFGTVKDPALFNALFAYSPYHHVVAGTKYPAILFMTGDNEGRVDPYHSRKRTARLQAANASDHPILLRTTAAAGHGIGTSLDESVAEGADVYAFLFDQLGMTAPQAKK